MEKNSGTRVHERVSKNAAERVTRKYLTTRAVAFQINPAGLIYYLLVLGYVIMGMVTW